MSSTEYDRIIEEFVNCMSEWRKKINQMDPTYFRRVKGLVPGTEESSMKKNDAVEMRSIINCFKPVDMRDGERRCFIDEDYLKETIKYCDKLIEKISSFKGKFNLSDRSQQNEMLRNIKNAIDETKAPDETPNMRNIRKSRGWHHSRLNSGVFTDFPFIYLGENQWSWISNWRQDIPEIIIERINCYLNAYNSLLRLYNVGKPVEDNNLNPIEQLSSTYFDDDKEDVKKEGSSAIMNPPRTTAIKPLNKVNNQELNLLDIYSEPPIKSGELPPGYKQKYYAYMNKFTKDNKGGKKTKRKRTKRTNRKQRRQNKSTRRFITNKRTLR